MSNLSTPYGECEYMQLSFHQPCGWANGKCLSDKRNTIEKTQCLSRQTTHTSLKEWNSWPVKVILRKVIKIQQKEPLTVAGPSDGAEQQLLALHDAAHPKHEGSPDVP
jgi:hypothetical protein